MTGPNLAKFSRWILSLLYDSDLNPKLSVFELLQCGKGLATLLQNDHPFLGALDPALDYSTE